MWNLTKNMLKIGIQTEPLATASNDIEKIGTELALHVSKRFGRALAIRMVDAGSCNACELEIQNTHNPYYNIERFGIHFVASPRHADMLLVTGPVTKNMLAALLRTYEAMPDPKLVVAVGDCAHCGGIFKNSYAVAGALDTILPVNVIIKGCPPTPTDIILGILKAIKDVQ